MNSDNIITLIRERFPPTLINTPVTDEERHLAQHLIDIMEKTMSKGIEIEVEDGLALDPLAEIICREDEKEESSTDDEDEEESSDEMPGTSAG